jgi:hypothetical protein
MKYAEIGSIASGCLHKDVRKNKRDAAQKTYPHQLKNNLSKSEQVKVPWRVN